MTSQVSVAMAELLADAQWVRALARALVADPHDADDLAQGACLLALRRPPSHGQNLRGWFQRVLENPLSSAILRGEFSEGDTITADVDGAGGLKLEG